MIKWKCTFCGNEAHIHDAVTLEGQHLYFCNKCNSQFNGVKPVTNIAIQKLIERKLLDHPATTTRCAGGLFRKGG